MSKYKANIVALVYLELCVSTWYGICHIMIVIQYTFESKVFPCWLLSYNGIYLKNPSPGAFYQSLRWSQALKCFFKTFRPPSTTYLVRSYSLARTCVSGKLSSRALQIRNELERLASWLPCFFLSAFLLRWGFLLIHLLCYFDLNVPSPGPRTHNFEEPFWRFKNHGPILRV